MSIKIIDVTQQEISEGQRMRWSRMSSGQLKKIIKDSKTTKTDKVVIKEILKSRTNFLGGK